MGLDVVMAGRSGAGATKNPARKDPAGHTSRVSISGTTLIWAGWSSAHLRPFVARQAVPKFGMPRVDRYDIIGMVLLALVLALWALHFSLPAPPPPDVVP
jgi:hypothetical protein